MAIKIAFMGFRHAHIFDLYPRAKDSSDYDVVAACEEDAETRRQLLESGKAEITFDSYEKMLSEVDCDVIAVGDYFGKRGEIIIEALSRGKHVLSDKPICTELEQLKKIEALSAAKGLKVGCMLDMRDSGLFLRMREIVQSGRLGEIHAVSVGGQHPLMPGTRPSWYFEKGKHGGTINDIAIHAFDAIPWLTGLEFDEVTAARSWNAFAPEFPHFHDAGQFMLKMSNGAGVMGDVSYFAPDKLGYKLDLYWRMTIFGREGVAETDWNAKGVTVVGRNSETIEVIAPCAPNPGGYLKAFAQHVKGEDTPLTTADTFKASRIGLLTQKAGFDNTAHIAL